MDSENRKSPSPADTPTNKPVDPGKKSKVKPEDKVYRKEEGDFGNIAEEKEKGEQPVQPVKQPPREK
jgi:hypothetical protein